MVRAIRDRALLLFLPPSVIIRGRTITSQMEELLPDYPWSDDDTFQPNLLLPKKQVWLKSVIGLRRYYD